MVADELADAADGVSDERSDVAPLGNIPRWLATVTSRWFVKAAFLVIFVTAVVQLLLFERWAMGVGPYVARPESVAGILPIGHFTSFFAWLRGGGWDMLLPAGLVLIMMSIAVSVLLKRGMCGWICPVGTVWEACAALGRRVLGRNVRVWRPLDIAGRCTRYLLALMFIVALLLVPVQEAVAFRELPYMWIADIKIVRLMAEPAWLAVMGVAAAASYVFGPVWCRYLCPLGGLYSAVGVVSLCAVERDDTACIQCHRCSQACHAFVEPEESTRVFSPECDGCMDCVRVCPVEGCLEAKVVSRVGIKPWVWPLLVVGLWLAIFGFAKALGAWDSRVPLEAYQRVVRSGLVEQRTRGFFD